MSLAARLLVALGVMAGVAVLVVAVASVVVPDLVRQLTTDLARFQPDPTRMTVLEARPFFLDTGNWSWRQPRVFFRHGGTDAKDG